MLCCVILEFAGLSVGEIAEVGVGCLGFCELLCRCEASNAAVDEGGTTEEPAVCTEGRYETAVLWISGGFGKVVEHCETESKSCSFGTGRSFNADRRRSGCGIGGA